MTSRRSASNQPPWNHSTFQDKACIKKAQKKEMESNGLVSLVQKWNRIKSRHIVGATPLVDSGPSNLLIRWPTLLIRWPTLLFRDPLCWFGFPLCWCGSTQLEKWESESWHRPECWFGSCLESTFWSMPKHRIYKVGHIYNLHGPRINKVCHV